MRGSASLLLATVFAGCGARSRAPGEDGIGLDGDADADTDTDADVDADTDSVTDTGGEGDLDLGPDARPSDYPEADDWHDSDPSKIGAGEPCCDLVGDAVELDGPQNASGPPVVAWNGEGWGVAWPPIAFRSLDPLGTPLGDVVMVSNNWTVLALEWGYDRYAVAAGGSVVGMLDRSGTLMTDLTGLGEAVGSPDVARYTHGNGWVVAYVDERGSYDYYDSEIRVLWASNEAETDGTSYLVGPGAGYRGPRVVGLRSRASVVWPTDDGVWHRSFRWPEVESANPEQPVLAAPIHVDGSIEAVAYRDYTVVAAMDGRDVYVVVVDPWEDAVVGGPEVVGDSPISDRRPGLAAVDERGYLGLCFEDGPGPYGGGAGSDDGVSFALVGPDATRWGEAVEVVGDLRNIGGCAVGWSGEDFIVVWWEAGLADNRILARRVRPRI
jgi:hypothetical protein